MTITVPMLDDFPSEDEEAQDRIRPAIYLPARMLSDAMPRTMARDVKRKRPIVVVIEVPSRDWLDVIRPVAQVHFRPADFIAKEEKLVRGTVQHGQDHALRAAIQVGHSFIALVVDAETQLSPTIIASADYRLRIPPPTNAQLAGTIRAVYGNARIGKLPPGIGEKATASAILAAIRPIENAGRAVARLRELDRRVAAPTAAATQISNGPTLSELTGYGAAKEWGLALAQDLQAYRRSEVVWAELSTAALLHGAPGLGKTYFAYALARSCGVPIVTTSLGQLFATTDGYLHSVIKGLDRAFRDARDQAPCVLFIDEIDAIPNRTTMESRYREYWSSVVTHLLKLLDDARNGVIIVAATNLPGHLDPALTRAGRLELHFEVTPPTSKELVGVFRHHLGERLPEAQLVSLAGLAQGSTGADVAFRSKAAIAEARRAGRELEFRDVAAQFLRNDVEGEDLRRVAIHEAGHAVAALALGRHVDHASTVQIGDRGGGVLTDGIGVIGTRQRLEDQVVIALAGRAAEILILGEGSSGSHKDLAAATAFACCIHGSLGLGATVLQRAPLADATRALADPKFRDLIEAELRILDARCVVLLTSHRTQLEAIAEALVQRRALTGAELSKLFI